MSIKSIAAKFAAGLVAVAAGIGLMALTAGPASAASYPNTVTKNHDVVAQISYDVHQNNIFHKADMHSFRYDTRGLTKGMPNTDTSWQFYLESAKADNTYGQDRLYMTELDSAGTIQVKVAQVLQFDYGSYPVSNDLTVTVAPNATKSFWVYTVGAGGDYIHSLVTLTNYV
jgi:hypothetical protein